MKCVSEQIFQAILMVLIILVVYLAALIGTKYLQNEVFYIRLRHNFQLIRLLPECTENIKLFFYMGGIGVNSGLGRSEIISLKLESCIRQMMGSWTERYRFIFRKRVEIVLSKNIWYLNSWFLRISFSDAFMIQSVLKTGTIEIL